MTELQIYSMNPPFRQKRVGSIGQPIAGMEVSLIDDSGHSVSGPGEIGEMIVRGGSMTSGYWQDPDLTARTICDGWLHTGDLAYRDAQDYLWFVSRKSEIIRSASGLVSPIEVEGVLYQHPAVREAGVVGVPDDNQEELVQAFVVLKENAPATTPAALLEFARERLPAHKQPSRVTVTRSLPAGPTGKIDRRTLRVQALSLQPSKA